MKSSPNSDFNLGEIIWPAHDSLLADLGFDTQELGEKAYGLVIRPGKERCLVFFPQIDKKLWMSEKEFRSFSHPSMAEFKKRESQGARSQITWFLSWVIEQLTVLEILDCGFGPLKELWQEPHEGLDKFCPDGEQNAYLLSLALPEFAEEQWKKIHREIENRLLFHRLLPAGMHKLELALYFGDT